jgi:hypothetical protein
MSTRVAVMIDCDRAGCSKRLHWSSDSGLSVSAAITSAVERYGWQASSKKALCPAHRPPAKGTHAFQKGTYGGSWCSFITGTGPYAKTCGHGPGHAVHQMPHQPATL